MGHRIHFVFHRIHFFPFYIPILCAFVLREERTVCGVTDNLIQSSERQKQTSPFATEWNRHLKDTGTSLGLGRRTSHRRGLYEQLDLSLDKSCDQNKFILRFWQIRPKMLTDIVCQSLGLYFLCRLSSCRHSELSSWHCVLFLRKTQ